MSCFEAATVLKSLEAKEKSVKTSIHTSQSSRKKLVYALVCETLKFKDVIDSLIGKTLLLQKTKQLRNNVWLARVLVYCLLFGKGLRGKDKTLVASYKSALSSALVRLKLKKKVSSNDQLIASSDLQTLPRYVRVNTLRTTVDSVIKQFQSEGFILKNIKHLPYPEFVDAIGKLGVKEFCVDLHIQQLLVFSTCADLHAHELYTSGQFIFQDKASCVPAFVLQELGLERGSHVIDCCAAPGNKTSHVAAVLDNTGKVFAFDKDQARVKTMKSMLETAGTTCVQTFHKDFLAIKPQDKIFKDVRYAVVDPSCSGSGIVNRLSVTADTDSSDSSTSERLHKLSQFQAHILKHALSFPRVERVIYSTCSVHLQENEDVVDRVQLEVKDRFEVVRILPSFSSRGFETSTNGSKCIRLSAEKDATNGFFVACFQRLGHVTNTTSGLDPQGEISETNDEGTVCDDSVNADCGDVTNGQSVAAPEVKSNPGSKKVKKKRSRSAAASRDNGQGQGNSSKRVKPDCTTATVTVRAANSQKNKRKKKRKLIPVSQK